MRNKVNRGLLGPLTTAALQWCNSLAFLGGATVDDPKEPLGPPCSSGRSSASLSPWPQCRESGTNTQESTFHRRSMRTAQEIEDHNGAVHVRCLVWDAQGTVGAKASINKDGLVVHPPRHAAQLSSQDSPGWNSLLQPSRQRMCMCRLVGHHVGVQDALDAIFPNFFVLLLGQVVEDLVPQGC